MLSEPIRMMSRHKAIKTSVPVGGEKDIYFLGGHDLEMAEIARVLREHGAVFVDRGLNWDQATFSAYEAELRAAIAAGQRPVLVEIRDIPADIHPFVDVIDHHGPQSAHLPTSLEQVLAHLGVTTLTREQALIAANDKGYIEGMLAIAATPEEIANIRRRDREAQGITAEQEALAESAVAQRTCPAPGLAIVELAHGKAACVTDRLSNLTGGPGYRNLFIESPGEVSFFGEGRTIEQLHRRFGGYCGGELPVRGYWGLEKPSSSERSGIREWLLHELGSSRSAG